MRPLPLRSTVSARFARLARRIGPVLLAGLGATACTFTTDFDAPFPATDATATDGVAADVGPDAYLPGSCEAICRDTVDCMQGKLCRETAFDDHMAWFEGYCRAHCEAEGRSVETVGDCNPAVVLSKLQQQYGAAFGSACLIDPIQSRCDAYCDGADEDGSGDRSLYELCFERPDSRISQIACRRVCSNLSLDFWRCVGAAEFKKPQAGDCVREKECAEAHPPARLLGRD